MSEGALAEDSSVLRAGDLLGGRYRVLDELGRGGMAIAYRVVDQIEGDECALKMLHLQHLTVEEERREARRLFEREYHSLVQLAHPRVVHVRHFERGAEGQLYYTMELLSGGDLRDIAPMPYKQVCRLLSDICSALSLLHSRRLLHRDITPRNVRCTADGLAKLIDFGAVMPFGLAHRVVGTPPFCAPEMMARQEVDGRADLFALGATAYYALTRRHAFPARDFSQLRDLWRSVPAPPSALVSGIPPALDELVLSLLQLDRNARPTHAAEVMERLCGIGGLDLAEELVVPQAYLTAPTLVGCDSQLSRVRRALVSTRASRAQAFVVTGPAGVGRTRFNSVCILEAQLLGLAALVIDGHNCTSEPYDGVRRLLSSLFEQLSGARGLMTAQEFQALSPLLAASPGAEPTHAVITERRSALQEAFIALVCRASLQRPLLLAIDDFAVLDEASQAVLALLAHRSGGARVALVATADTPTLEAPTPALHMLAARAQIVELENLQLPATRRLLTSIFGEVPHLDLWVRHLYQLSSGNPAALVQISQFLLEQAVVRYEAGSWVLPAQLKRGVLPPTLMETHRQHLRALPQEARRLAQVLSLLEVPAASPEELLILAQRSDQLSLLPLLDTLLSADVLRTDGETYSLARRGLLAPLQELLEPEERRAYHLRVAQLLALRGQTAFVYVAHLLRGFDFDEALNVMEREFERLLAESHAEGFTSIMKEMPADWLPLLRALLAHCPKRPRPAYDRFIVHLFLLYCVIRGGLGATHLGPLLATFEDEIFGVLARDSGLEIYATLVDTPEEQRLGRALEEAQRRYEAAGDDERVLPPLHAVQQLAHTALSVAAAAAGVMDRYLLTTIPSLEPLSPLSSGLRLVDLTVKSTTRLLSSCYGEAEVGWNEILAMIAAGNVPLRADDLRIAKYTIIYALGVVDASFGRPRALERALEVEQEPVLRVHAERIRMNYAFRIGDVDMAQAQRRRAELATLQYGAEQMVAGTHLMVEILSYIAADDLVRMKRLSAELSGMAERFPGWMPVRLVALGHQHRMRGEYEQAIGTFELALEMTVAGGHIVWPLIVTGLLHSLRLAGDPQAAVRRGREALKAAQDAKIEQEFAVGEALGYALLEAGEVEEARLMADFVVAGWTRLQAGGMTYGSSLELRARIAIAMEDWPGFELYAEKCRELFGAVRNSGLAARYQRLLRAAYDARGDHLPQGGGGGVDVSRSYFEETLAGLTETSSLHEHAERIVDLLCREAHAPAGALFVLGEQGLQLAFASAGVAWPPELERQLGRILCPDIDDGLDRTQTAFVEQPEAGADVVFAGSLIHPSASAPSASSAAHFSAPLVLKHVQEDREMTTAVAVLSSAEQDGVYIHPALLELLSRNLARCGCVVPRAWLS